MDIKCIQKVYKNDGVGRFIDVFCPINYLKKSTQKITMYLFSLLYLFIKKKKKKQLRKQLDIFQKKKQLDIFQKFGK